MSHTKQLQDIFIGQHNADLERTRARLAKSGSYRNLSTIWVTPIPSDPEEPNKVPMIPAVVSFQYMNLMMPMNQAVFRLPVTGMEVGAAYNYAVETILNNPALSKFRYMLTVEYDNLPPPDGLLKLYESIQDYDVVGGLYFTKGDQGQPLILGSPKEMPWNYIPQIPIPDTVQPTNAMGMGFTLFRLDMFRKLEKPWFKTQQSWEYGKGAAAATQDCYFFSRAAAKGFKFAVDTRVRVGHLSLTDGVIW